MPKYPSVDLGPLPADLINDALDTELEPGTVHLSAQAHRHIARDHPADYPICFPNLQKALQQPTYIGQGPRGDGNFEIIYRVHQNADSNVLIAVGLDVDDDGAYRVKSTYLLKDAVVEKRRTAGTLKIPRRR